MKIELLADGDLCKRTSAVDVNRLREPPLVIEFRILTPGELYGESEYIINEWVGFFELQLKYLRKWEKERQSRTSNDN